MKTKKGETYNLKFGFIYDDERVDIMRRFSTIFEEAGIEVKNLKGCVCDIGDKLEGLKGVFLHVPQKLCIRGENSCLEGLSKIISSSPNLDFYILEFITRHDFSCLRDLNNVYFLNRESWNPIIDDPQKFFRERYGNGPEGI